MRSFVIIVVIFVCLTGTAHTEELSGLLKKMNHEKEADETMTAVRMATSNKKEADQLLSRLTERLEATYSEILDVEFNKISKRKFNRIGRMIINVLNKPGEDEKIESLKLRMLAGISDDIFVQYADFLNFLLKIAEKVQLDSNSQADEPCLPRELDLQHQHMKALDHNRSVKKLERTVCFYVAKNLAGEVFRRGIQQCGTLSGVYNQGTQTSSFITLMHNLPSKKLTIKQAAREMFFSLHKVFAEVPLASTRTKDFGQRHTKQCNAFIDEFSAYINSTTADVALNNQTRAVYNEVKSKSPEPIAWLSQSIKQRDEILQGTGNDATSVSQYCVDYFYDVLQIEKNKMIQ